MLGLTLLITFGLKMSWSGEFFKALCLTVIFYSTFKVQRLLKNCNCKSNNYIFLMGNLDGNGLLGQSNIYMPVSWKEHCEN